MAEPQRTALPHPVYFVLRYADKWRSLIEASARLEDAGADIDALHRDIATNEECWILSTYLRLRPRIANVYLTDRPQADAICVVSGLDFGIRDFRLGSFYVGTRSDGPAPALCHLSVVQNELQARRGWGSFVPHWPQPGLVPRDPGRRNRIENMVFYGNEANLERRFRAPAFEQALSARGVAFRVGAGGHGAPAGWHDYAEADLVLAVRNLTQADAITKPASKLVNAWLAGVPALLGPEPAFQELRRSELDYFEIQNAADALGVVDRLKSDGALYQRCVENGRARSCEFSVEAVASRWIDFLSQEVSVAFEAWRRRGVARRAASFALGAIAHKRAGASAARARLTGPRILGSP